MKNQHRLIFLILASGFICYFCTPITILADETYKQQSEIVSQTETTGVAGINNPLVLREEDITPEVIEKVEEKYNVKETEKEETKSDTITKKEKASDN